MFSRDVSNMEVRNLDICLFDIVSDVNFKLFVLNHTILNSPVSKILYISGYFSKI